MSLPPTVEAAAAAGWTGLQAECPACRKTVIVPWQILCGDRRRVPLLTVAAKLRCSGCRQPPATVALHRMVILRQGGAPEGELLALEVNAPATESLT